VSKRKCGWCGKDPAEGVASVNDTFYCHGDEDPEPTCYMRSQRKYVAPDAALVEAMFEAFNGKYEKDVSQ
jgi:hypothetical protein